jgi:hypothetical protein
MNNLRKSLIALFAMSQVAFTTSLVRANDPAAAEVLFQEGRKLMAEGQIGAGCEKLKDSFALDPMSGTLLNLADCYEKQGRTATAWARFQNAVSLAKNQGKTEQAAEANRRLKVLEAQLSQLTILVPEPVPGLEVRRDDVEVSPSTYGVRVPVDPGSVVVVASAAGYRTVRLNVEIGAHRDKKSVTIPKLEKLEIGETAEAAGPSAVAEEEAAKEEPKPEVEPKKPPPAQQKPVTASEPMKPPEPEVVSAGLNRTPLIVGGAGLAIAATGGVFGYLATQSNHDANFLCPTHRDCSAAALDKAKKRDNQAMVANIGVGVGLAVVAASAIWLIVGGSSDDRDSARIGLQPAVAPGLAGLLAAGHF